MIPQRDERSLAGFSMLDVGNFLSVHRVRPRDDDEDDGNSDDIISDEELELSHEHLKDALTTRIGGRETNRADACLQSHFLNSESAMELGADIWTGCDTSSPSSSKEPKFRLPAEDLDQILSAARSSQRKEKSFSSRTSNEERDPALSQLTCAKPIDVERWLDKLKCASIDGRLRANAEQFAAVKIVALRVIEELRSAADGTIDPGEPLRWCVHGGPGTGKSHVIALVKELFADVLGWDMGVEFQLVALQAVMADLIGGDTIHHACGIPVFGRGKIATEDLQKHLEVARRVLQWRWLNIDEISMVSAQLFAEMDMKLRKVVRDVGTTKIDKKQLARPFGGLNVLCCGDFWQLPPPDGGFIGDIPTEFIQNARKYQPAPTIAHGQSLFWGGGDAGIQGITELEQIERCDDMWLKEVQEELRQGNLSQNNYNFLHGTDTTVPGSWVNQDVACGKSCCRALAEPNHVGYLTLLIQ